MRIICCKLLNITRDMFAKGLSLVTHLHNSKSYSELKQNIIRDFCRLLRFCVFIGAGLLPNVSKLYVLTIVSKHVTYLRFSRKPRACDTSTLYLKHLLTSKKISKCSIPLLERPAHNKTLCLSVTRKFLTILNFSNSYRYRGVYSIHSSTGGLSKIINIPVS